MEPRVACVNARHRKEEVERGRPDGGAWLCLQRPRRQAPPRLLRAILTVAGVLSPKVAGAA
jgi:hypothetical protein